MIERFKSNGDLIQISTAPGRDGIVRRIAVKARESGTSPGWIAFALTNSSDEQIERLLVAPHFRLVGSGIVWPDLGSTRIAAITASEGIRPERENSADADLFQITIDPGTTVTYVAELASADVGQVYLWEAEAYKQKLNGLTLYKGIIIGIAGLLALFLTIVFVVKGALIFPAAAALAWSVLIYACIDFGFFQRIFPIPGTTERIYRAGAEAILAATLLVFLFAYLNLNRWHIRYSTVSLFWLVFLTALVGLAVVDPEVASGVSRISIGVLAAVGLVLILHLAFRGFDRAIMLIPTWLLLVVWVAAAGLTVTGRLGNDLVQPGLIGGLVLIVMLIGFTVMQHAFSGGVTAGGLRDDAERRALALAGSGDLVFDWDVSGDKVYVSPEIEHQLGLKRGTLSGHAADWVDAVHALDRDKYRAALDAVLENRRGRIGQDFRLRSSAGAYHWFRLKARPVVGTDGEVVRVIGTLSDVTDTKIPALRRTRNRETPRPRTAHPARTRFRHSRRGGTGVCGARFIACFSPLPRKHGSDKAGSDGGRGCRYRVCVGGRERARGQPSRPPPSAGVRDSSPLAPFAFARSADRSRPPCVPAPRKRPRRGRITAWNRLPNTQHLILSVPSLITSYTFAPNPATMRDWFRNCSWGKPCAYCAKKTAGRMSRARTRTAAGRTRAGSANLLPTNWNLSSARS